MATHIRINLDSFTPVYEEFKKTETETDEGVNMEPFSMPLFIPHPAKRYIALTKYRAITKFLRENPSEHAALDFETGSGAFLPIPSHKFHDIIAVNAFEDHVTVARNLVIFMKLVKKWKVHIMQRRTTQITLKDDIDIIQQSLDVGKMNKSKWLRTTRNQWLYCWTTKYRLSGTLCGYKQYFLWCIT